MCKFDIPAQREYAVGMVFLPRSSNQSNFCVAAFEDEIKKQGLRIIGWRDVPVNSKVLGEVASVTEPFVKQIFIGKSNTEQTNHDFNLKKGSILFYLCLSFHPSVRPSVP